MRRQQRKEGITVTERRSAGKNAGARLLDCLVTAGYATAWAYCEPHDYAHDVAGKAREAEVTATIAAARAKLTGTPAAAAPPPVAVECAEILAPSRCEGCGYLLTSAGHRVECGESA
jgi:hypothetical protein